VDLTTKCTRVYLGANPLITVSNKKYDRSQLLKHAVNEVTR